MKKIFAIMMIICLLASVLCITAFAADLPAEDVVLRVSALKRDGTTIVIKDYTVFEDGWNAAMELADNSKEMKKNDYARVIVDIYADWNAVDGEFTKEFFNGKGFNWDAIYFQPNVRMTLNLNGHTINRGLTDWEYNGEVMYIDKDADVIINDGTITGGFSCNGAGGIHINDGANVVLNNVNIVGNAVEDDDGAGIAVYDGATLTMIGGRVSDNFMKCSDVSLVYGAGIYIEDCTANFFNVTFQNNHSKGQSAYCQDQFEAYCTYGAAIYAEQSTVTIDTCCFYDNGHKLGNFIDTDCVIRVTKSKMTVKNTIFKDNGCGQIVTNGHSSFELSTKLFNTYNSALTIESCRFIENKASVLLCLDSDSTLIISDTTFTDNNAAIYYGAVASTMTSSVSNCTFDRNRASGKYPYLFEFTDEGNQPTFVDCDFGNSTFNNKSLATFIDSNADVSNDAHLGTLIGQGNISMFLSLLAIFIACTALCVGVNKDKRVKALFERTSNESND